MTKYQYDAKTTILQFLFTFPYLTATRIATLYSPGSIQRIRGYLHELSEDDNEKAHVHRAYLFSQAQNKEYVYWLSTSGRRHLRALDTRYDFTGWKRPWQMGQVLAGMEFRHHMTTTDFFLAALQTDVQILETTHYYHIRLPKKITPVIPDGVLKTAINTYLLEIDLNTENSDTIAGKMTNYIPYITSGQFAHDYGVGEVPTIVFYTPTEKRRDELLRIIEQTLLKSYHASKATWFRVVCGTLSPELFTSKIWITPAGLKDRKVMSLFSNS